MHKFDRIQEFNQLLIAMREIEEQHRQDSALKEKSSTSSPDKENISSDETTELKAMVQKLTAQLQEKETRTSTLTKNSMSTLVALLLPTFSGDNRGDDVSYDLWRYQVACLIKENYRHEIIAQAIRRSVHGTASRIVMRLGVEATVDDVIDRMDSIFGSVDVKEVLLAQFYTACQGDDEDVSSWGCRLEDILNKALLQKEICQLQHLFRTKL
ncbi:unnamed protein product [Mytilus coruscus]|uniref:Paraneoplastic antigen Ma-like C-terminal domain-containing protein n=1 Tax=Mytilus coruscus TaxID=42192 RepID=A0A6J8ADX7_MYTCO|nr:unnamed protein product [Mytilus coruscus]